MIESCAKTLLIGLLLGILTNTADAQSYSRPTSRGGLILNPSERFGRVGGAITGQRSVTSLGGQRGAASRGYRGIPSINHFGAAGNITRLPRPAIPQAFLMGRQGYRAQGERNSVFRFTGEYSRDRATWVSEFGETTKLYTPLAGWGDFVRDVPKRPYYVTQPEDPVARYYGLEPAAQLSATSQREPFESIAVELEKANGRLLEELRKEAIDQFRRATTDGVADPVQEINKAQGLLHTVFGMDPSSYETALLLVHAALAKDQIELANYFLFDAVRTNPLLFSSDFDISKYYGSPIVLERLMRMYQRIGDDNEENVAGYAMQGYCAWVLKDRARIKHALEKLKEGTVDQNEHRRLIQFTYALSGALQ